MEKRVLIAVLLSFLVIYIYQALIPAPPPARPAPAATPAPAPQVQPAPATPGTPTPTTEPPAPPAQPLVADAVARDIVLENEAVRAVFTTRGGVLKQWTLKHYQDGGRPLELVPLDLPAGIRRPFDLSFDEPALGATLSAALFRPTLGGAGQNRSLTLDYQDQSGIRARKVFALGTHPFVVTFSIAAHQGERALNPVVSFGPALGNGRDVTGSGTYTLPRAIFSKERDVTRVSAGDLAAPRIEEGTFDFAGADDHYFMSAVLLPRKPLRVEYRRLDIAGSTEAEARQFVQYTARFASTPENERLFLGPKDFDVLAAVDRNLTRAVDFGVFAWLVVPLLRALKWVNAGIGNYGWSIIILTVLINLVMFPLRHKSVVSMRKLQEIQPQVKAIQDRYAKLKMTDPARQKMNVEMMNLYREKGVNPASGCVPMLLTFPVLFAFYALLSVAIELRGAPWIWWIRDLSLHDPFYVTPILMGGTMFWQQKLTPMNVDPVQQKIFMLTPIMFTFFFLWAPAGVVLYWLVSNLWAIGQQLVTNRLIGPPPQHAVRPAAERKVKKVGSGKTDQAR
ncbi:MAG TPA: membrane protein insertase YidC [Vicinamibacterales bacterium]|nr:membrane protein insertase YidC [Vicinamibacterales bacterium]